MKYITINGQRVGVPMTWYCCGFLVAARSRKEARREFERRGIAFFHVLAETRRVA